MAMEADSQRMFPVSDTAAAPSSSQLDTTGPYIASTLRTLPPSLFYDVKTAIVPDDVDQIRATVERWASAEEVDLIITSGGTGWGARDVTVQVSQSISPILRLLPADCDLVNPTLTCQALTPLISKPLPSLSQALTAYGLSKTPLASLSNPLCGIIASTRRTLLVALPGSKGGVKDGMAVLVSSHSPAPFG